MCSRFPKLLGAFFIVLAFLPAIAASPLRICADPDNLPFSNRAGAGFDNRIAILIAHDLRREPVFVWVRPRRGFLREQFNRNACDVLLGVPTGMRVGSLLHLELHLCDARAETSANCLVH